MNVLGINIQIVEFKLDFKPVKTTSNVNFVTVENNNFIPLQDCFSYV